MNRLTALTKRIQELVHSVPDGIWGENTAIAVLTALNPQDPLLTKISDTPSEIPNSNFIDKNQDDLIGDRVHRICTEVISVFETGRIQGDYSALSLYNDGPGNAKQITYGKFQTTESGNLSTLLEMYLSMEPDTRAASIIRERLPKVGKKPYLVNDKEFLNALKEAGQEPTMQEAQDRFFDEIYWDPAYSWFHDNGFTLPLSMLVIFDSFIHSGSILKSLRNKFRELPPSQGGNEKNWITEYVQARRNWLANHSRTILHATVYRMDTMIDAIRKENWLLEQPVNAHGIIISPE